MIRKLPSTVLAIIVAVCLSSALFVAHAETQQQTSIKITNVDMYNQAEVNELYASIVYKATSMCEQMDASGVVTRYNKSWSNRVCTKRSVQRAIKDAAIPALTTAHKSVPYKIRYSADAVRQMHISSSQ